MRKTEWIEEYNRELENYDKSILNNGEEYDSMKDYEFSITRHSDCELTSEDLYEPIGHFKD